MNHGFEIWPNFWFKYNIYISEVAATNFASTLLYVGGERIFTVTRLHVAHNGNDQFGEYCLEFTFR